MEKKVLKLDEWKSASGNWYVADVKTWTGWRECANVLDVEEEVNHFIDLLVNKYNAVVRSYDWEKDFLHFCWPFDDYKNAHQFKLDINRIARKKNYLI